MLTLVSVSTRYSSGLLVLVDLRTVSLAVGTTRPDTASMITSGVAASINLVSERSWIRSGTARPALFLRVCAVPSDSPHDQARTSISSLCLSSSDSPLMSPSFRNMSLEAAAPIGHEASAAARDTVVANRFKYDLFIESPMGGGKHPLGGSGCQARCGRSAMRRS